MSDFNDRIIEEFRSHGGRVDSMGFGSSLVILHSVGARTGEIRLNPVMAVPEGDPDHGSWLIIASAAGNPKNPAWYANLKEHPDILIETPDGEVEVTATELEGEERQAAWEAFTSIAPGFLQYQVSAGARILPIFRLVRR